MDKLCDAILKLLPPHFLIALFAAAISFFAIYYWMGYRSYADAIRDHLFLTLLVLIAAGAVIYTINQEYKPDPAKTPLVIIPYFRNDELDQFRTAIGTQIESAFGSALSRNRTIYYVNSFLTDPESAVQTAKRYKAVAVIHGPPVIKDGNDLKGSFRLSTVSPEITKTYSLLPLEATKESLEDIVLTVLSAGASDPQTAPAVNPLLSRLDALEKAVARLQAGLTSMLQVTALPKPIPQYKVKRAIIVGVNGPAGFSSQLQAAVSDAIAVAETLKAFDFLVQLLTGAAATRANLIKEIIDLQSLTTDKDLFVLYFAGHASATKTKSPVLQLLTYDFSDKESSPALSLRDIQSEIDAIPSLHKLVILDAVNGTVGIEPQTSSSPLNPQQPIFQFLAGCQDDQYGYETAQGGFFTQNLLKVLRRADPMAGI